MATKQYSLIGSSGEMETYPDPYADESPETAQAAEVMEQAILAERNKAESSFLKMAFLLDEFDSKQLYLSRSFDSMKTWTEDPSIEISWRLALDLMRIPRQVVPALEENGYTFEQAIALLSEAKVSKIRAAMPLLAEGFESDFVALVEEAPNLTLKDVNREVRAIRKGDESDDDRPALFKAFVRRGDTHTMFKVITIKGDLREEAGTLRVHNDDAPRMAMLFGDRHVEYVDG